MPWRHWSLPDPGGERAAFRAYTVRKGGISFGS
jgi:hypothetical protein